VHRFTLGSARLPQPCSRAIHAIDAPGTNVASTMRRFSSAVRTSRLPELAPARTLGSGQLHHHFATTLRRFWLGDLLCIQVLGLSAFRSKRNCYGDQISNQLKKKPHSETWLPLRSFADLDNGEGFIQVFTSNKSMNVVPKALLPDVDQKWLQPKGAGVWYAKFPLSSGTQDDNPLFSVFGYLGFALFL